ncbi:P-loop containing nucleoside triphosphate hydrolase protein [Xylariaceae sp. AK1471]|nr:P-loop containing nucleoside triphosphate hydrolase protein [Xylariaceae sp. AK1471]
MSTMLPVEQSTAEKRDTANKRKSWLQWLRSMYSPPAPDFTANLLSRYTFEWMTPIMVTGHRRKLEVNDLWLVNPDRPFRDRVHKGSKHPLMAALHDTFKREFWIVVVPFVLRFLLNFLAAAYKAAMDDMPERHPGPPIGRGLGIVVCTNQFIYRGFMIGAQKALKLSDQSLPGGAGFMMSLLSSDTARIDQAAGLFHLIWVSPITIFLTLALLLVNISYSALPGFGLLFFGVAGLTFGLKTLMRRRKQINSVTDARVSLTQEILRSIPFMQKLEGIRKEEIKGITKLQLTRNAINSISIVLPILGAMLSFITYATTSHTLTVAPIFSSLALFNAIRVPFNLLPVVIGQKLFLAEDHDDHIDRVATSEYALEVSKAQFSWENCSATSSTVKRTSISSSDARSSITLATQSFSFRDLSFTVNRGELLAIVGSVGSGKSSLLSALAGEMPKSSGQILQGLSTRAYCPQDAWIQNTTLRDNITFGRPFDAAFYNKVIEACCLLPDLQSFAAGDSTEIGEKGINLSGGQRQRVNLARAMYSDSELILMDDPLSAVDAHVGKHMFERGICGILGDKTRILATHQLHVLSRCDRVLWLEYGSIKAIGTFQELHDTNAEFQEMIIRYSQKESQPREKTTSDIEKKTSPGEAEEKRPETTSDNGALIKDEEMATGSLPLSLYAHYIRSSGSLFYGLIPIVLLIVAQVANTLTNIWLSWWVSGRFNLTRGAYIGVCVFIGIFQAILFFCYGGTISVFGGKASGKIVHTATTKVIKAPLSFHDSQPLGRIMNRLSRDAEVMDNQLSEALRMFVYTLAIVTSIIVLLSYYFQWFLVAIVPLGAIVVYAAVYYKASAGQLKRHEAALRGVTFAKFGESMSGVQTIRAYGAQARTLRRLHEAIDDMDSAYFLTLSNQRWVTTRLDLVAAAVVTTTGILVTTLRTAIDPSVSGLVLSYVLGITQMMQLVVRSLTEVENAMVSTERLHEYEVDLPQEPEQTGDVPPSWPSKGEVDMKDIVLQYRSDLPPVLQGLNLKIEGGQKVGIVGRTGAGKTSMSAALFRLVELSGGQIFIDGLDIAQLPLRELRSRISVVPQDPTLFKGTVRSNLDPFDERTDMDLWHALHSAGIEKPQANGSDNSLFNLDSPVEEEGKNFSKGQRQLLAIARALVRDCRIVVCDEATSSVDPEADAKVQRTIMEAFSGKTVLTIAHRLDTIINYDRVCVLEKGRVLEFDTPLTLWESNGAFRGLCDQSGIRRQDFKRSVGEIGVVTEEVL